jgi:hypothetical protein
MILPARCKQFFAESSFGQLHKDLWDCLWYQAAEALRRSDEILICGYSIPQFDNRACELLVNEDYSASIEVCCGGDTQKVVEQLRSAGRKAHSANETHFNEWLDQRIRPG